MLFSAAGCDIFDKPQKWEIVLENYLHNIFENSPLAILALGFFLLWLTTSRR